VFQDFQLLIDRSVNENLEFVLRATGWKDNADVEKRINEVLEKVGLSLKGYKMPHQLSGGEQQRCRYRTCPVERPGNNSGRRAYREPRSRNIRRYYQVIEGYKHTGRAVIIATHNYTIVKKIQCQDYQVRKRENGRGQR